MSTLKKYSEELIKKISKDDSSSIIEIENRRTFKAMANKLAHDDMISFLIIDKGCKLTPEEILNKLISSNDLRGFLQELLPDDDDIDSFIERNDPHATEHYIKLKERYSS